jgi:butyrate kinase
VALASRDFFRPALRLLHTERAAFEVGLFSLPDSHPEGVYQKNLVAFADVAINVEPSARELAQIAVGACKIFRDLVPTDILPNVNGALLSYSTRGSADGASVSRIREAGLLVPALLAELARRDPLYATIRIEAELQISCAISIAAARSKAHEALLDPNSPLGRSNVLIVANLDAGNLLYHLYATRYADADRVLLVGGMESRVLDFSRSSTTEDVVLGAMSTILRLQRQPDVRRIKDRFFPEHRVLVVNPGSTSTKVSAFQGPTRIAELEVRHDSAEIARCATLWDQIPMRSRVVHEMLRSNGIEVADMDAVVGRGGLIRPVISGTWRVGDAMLEDLEAARYGEHASNLGAPIAHHLAAPHGKPAFIVDPVVVDELDPVSRVVGVAGHERRSIWHALSQKAVARRYADETLGDYEDLDLLVCHMGGGVTVGVHRKGRCTWVNDGLTEGPMTPERAGSLPNAVWLDLVFKEGMDEKSLRKLMVGRGGLLSLLGTSDLREVERRVEAGEARAVLIWKALCESIAAAIAGAMARFDGRRPAAILLTGGMARSKLLVDRLLLLLDPLQVPVRVYPGEFEAEALREGAVRVLRGVEQAMVYGEEAG